MLSRKVDETDEDEDFPARLEPTEVTDVASLLHRWERFITHAISLCWAVSGEFVCAVDVFVAEYLGLVFVENIGFFECVSIARGTTGTLPDPSDPLFPSNDTESGGEYSGKSISLGFLTVGVSFDRFLNCFSVVTPGFATPVLFSTELNLWQEPEAWDCDSFGSLL
jgi:hypothetical protein